MMLNLSGNASDSPAQPQPGPDDFTLGGQAVIEGVMMRSPNFVAVAVRRATGEIAVYDEPATSLIKRYPALNKPLVRGVFALAESMVFGIRALNYSANAALDDEMANEAEAEPAKAPNRIPQVAGVVAILAVVGLLRHRLTPALHHGLAWVADPSRRVPVMAAAVLVLALIILGIASGRKSNTEAGAGIGAAAISVTIGFAFLLGIGLFVVVPNIIAQAVISRYSHQPLLFNLFEGIVRMAIFVAYIGLISFMPDIRRVFAYHGAEHKVVWTQERRLPLEPNVAQQFPTAHPRCGTSFALFVLVLSIIVFAFLGWPAWYWRILSRLVLLPLVAGIGYEILKQTAKHGGSAVVRALILPGLWLQRMTTRQPDTAQLEVAIRAMEVVLQREADHRAGLGSALSAGG